MSRLLLAGACLAVLVGPILSLATIATAEAGFNICAIPAQAFRSNLAQWDAQVRSYIETPDQMHRRAGLHPGDSYRFLTDLTLAEAGRYSDLPGFVLIGSSLDRHGCPRPDRISVFVEVRDPTRPTSLAAATRR